VSSMCTPSRFPPLNPWVRSRPTMPMRITPSRPRRRRP
jgi:hypothetical protein